MKKKIFFSKIWLVTQVHEIVQDVQLDHLKSSESPKGRLWLVEESDSLKEVVNVSQI